MSVFFYSQHFRGRCTFTLCFSDLLSCFLVRHLSVFSFTLLCVVKLSISLEMKAYFFLKILPRICSSVWHCWVRGSDGLQWFSLSVSILSFQAMIPEASVSSVVSVSLSLPWAYILAVFTDLMNGSLSRVILILYIFKKSFYT